MVLQGGQTLKSRIVLELSLADLVSLSTTASSFFYSSLLENEKHQKLAASSQRTKGDQRSELVPYASKSSDSA